MTVVAVGASGGVSRRVEVGLASYDGENVFKDAKLVGENGVTMNGNGMVSASLSTNGTIDKNGGSGQICSDVRVGYGEIPEKGLCETSGYTISEGEKGLPAIVPPEDIATNNDDCRLETPHPAGCNGIDTHTGSDPWHPGTGKPGTIKIGSNATLTMGGRDYLVCSLSVDARGQLFIGAAEQALETGHVRIFVDTPEHCGLKAGATQVEINGSATSTGYIPAEGKYEMPQIYVLGSPTISTKVKLCGKSGTNEIILYAPYSDIEICGTANWIGMIAGKSLALNGNGEVKSDPHMPLPKLAAQSLWERTRYVECTGATASPPNASC